MKVTSENKLDTYYKEAGSWASDKILILQKSRIIAWRIAGCFIFISILLLIALIQLMPLKKIVPYTILVDKHTGFVEVVKPLEANNVKPDTALTESFLVQYISAREGFDFNSIQRDFKRVAIWTSEPEKSKYIKLMQASNPESPLVLYPRSTIISVKLKSITKIGTNTYLARFDTVRIDQNGNSQVGRSWAAVIKYEYSNTPLSQEERYINPLGFKVINYNKSEEIIPSNEAKELSFNEVEKPNSDVTQPSLLGGNSNKQSINPPLSQGNK